MEKIESKEIITLVTEMKNKVDKILDKILKEVGITKAQALILMSINKDKRPENCNVNDIVSELELNQGNTSSLLKKMEKMELIERTRAKNDERRVEIIITDKGKEKLKAIEKRMEKLREKINNGYDTQKKINLINGMRQLDDFINFLVEEE